MTGSLLNETNIEMIHRSSKAYVVITNYIILHCSLAMKDNQSLHLFWQQDGCMIRLMLL
jgi:hypothetical protein